MYPLFLCSILTFTIGLERAYYYLKACRRNDIFDDVKFLTIRGETENALTIAEKSNSPVAAVLAEAIKNKDKGISAIEESVSLKGSYELKGLTKNLHILELIGRIAPLLGLLGTVLGMVNAFKTVSSVKGAVDPAILAGGIWEALLTTVAGLVVAIPALVLHHFFEDRVKTIAFQMKHCAAEIISLLTGENK